MNCQGLCHGFVLHHYTKIMALIFEKSYSLILGMAPIISHTVRHRYLFQKRNFMVFSSAGSWYSTNTDKLSSKYSWSWEESILLGLLMVIELKFPKETTDFGFSFEMLKNRFFSASKVYLQIKFPIIVSFLHIPYQIPVVRVSRKSVTICEKLLSD